MPINLNGKASEAAKQLAQAFQGEDAAALESAFANFQSEVAEQLAEQFREAMETHDEQVLIQRGFPQLTKQETRYFEAVIDALKSANPKQALATIGDGTGAHDLKDRMMPETFIDEVLKDIEASHPLLAKIGVRNVGYVTTWLRNKHTRQLAVWGNVESTITKEIQSAFEVVSVTQGKLSCFAAVSQDMLNLGPRWMAAYVRVCLVEAMACGLEYGVLKGKGIGGEPTGLNRNILGAIDPTTGKPAKTAVAVTSFDPASYGALVAQLAKTDPINGVGTERVKDKLDGLTLACNPVDYLTKVMPATTVLNANGNYVNNLFPIPTDTVTSDALAANEAILFLAGEYDLVVGGNRGIEYSDDYQFLEDNRVFKTVQYANGMPRWNTSAIVLDLTNLDPAYLNVMVKGTVKTKEQA